MGREEILDKEMEDSVLYPLQLILQHLILHAILFRTTTITVENEAPFSGVRETEQRKEVFYDITPFLFHFYGAT